MPKTAEEMIVHLITKWPNMPVTMRNFLEYYARKNGIDYDNKYDQSFREVELHHANNE